MGEGRKKKKKRRERKGERDGGRAARDEMEVRKNREGTVGGKKEKMEQRLKSDIRTSEILGGD